MIRTLHFELDKEGKLRDNYKIEHLISNFVGNHFKIINQKRYFAEGVSFIRVTVSY